MDPWRQAAGASLGRALVEYLAEGERAVAFWRRYENRLTQPERHRIAKGDYASIVRPLAPAWQDGDWLEVRSNLSIQVIEVRWRRQSYRTTFNVRDFRVRRVRRVPQMFDPPDRDELGIPVPHTASAIEDARLDGNYTASAALAVPEDDEAIDDDVQNRITKDANELGRLRELVEHPERVVEQDQKRKQNKLRKLQAEARKKGIDITPELDGAIRDIQAKLAA